MKLTKYSDVTLIVLSNYPAVENTLPFEPHPISWWLDWLDNHMLDLLPMLQWQKHPILAHEGVVEYEVSYDAEGNIDGFILTGER